MNKNIYLNILLVFLCLYTFLIGIKGLSSAINKISSPDEIFPGDQVQLKYILVDEEKIKKAWVEVQTEPDQNGDFSFLYRKKDVDSDEIREIVGQGNVSKKKKVASKWFLEATNSAFICLFIGIFATVIFQSSSTNIYLS